MASTTWMVLAWLCYSSFPSAPHSTTRVHLQLSLIDLWYGQQPPVLEAIKKVTIPSDMYFKFNNSALFAYNRETKESFDAIFGRISFLSFQNIFAELAKTASVSLGLTKEVLNGKLHILIEGLHPQIAKALNKIEEMRQEELQNHV